MFSYKHEAPAELNLISFTSLLYTSPAKLKKHYGLILLLRWTRSLTLYEFAPAGHRVYRKESPRTSRLLRSRVKSITGLINPFKKKTLFIRHSEFFQKLMIFLFECFLFMMRFLVQHIFTDAVNLRMTIRKHAVSLPVRSGGHPAN
jgi:hypothetical protein